MTMVTDVVRFLAGEDDGWTAETLARGMGCEVDSVEGALQLGAALGVLTAWPRVGAAQLWGLSDAWREAAWQSGGERCPTT